MSVSYSEFLDSLSPEQLGVFLYLDKIFLEIEGVTRKMRYRVPFYDYGQWICYINPKPDNKAELCFLDGKLLIKDFPLLQSKERKRVAGLPLDAEEDLDKALILDIFHAARPLQKDS